MTPISEQFRLLRTKRGLSREQVAKAANMDYIHYCQIERGNLNPRTDTVSKIAAALGCGVFVLPDDLGVRYAKP